MRRAKFEQFEKEVKERSKSLGMIHLQNPAGRAIRTKPRDATELDILLKLALQRKKEALESGEYEIISPRRWRIRARHTKEAER